jgi:hypothetical protein
VNILLVAAGPAAAEPVADALGEVAGVREVEVAAVPEPAGRAELDPVLDGLAGRRLVLAGSPAALGDLLIRLRRRDELAATPVAVLHPGDPAGPAEAARIAATGLPRPVDLVRDDHGGVLLDRAELTGWQWHPLGMRVYADDTRLAAGEVGGLTVIRTGAGTLRAEVRPVRRRWLGRVSRPAGGPVATGRAVQVSCDEARLTVDGRAHSRPVTRRAWWVEPAGWLLVSRT